MTPQEMEALVAQYPGPVSISRQPPGWRTRAFLLVIVIVFLLVPGVLVVTRAVSPWDGEAFGFGAFYLITGILGVGALLGGRPVVSRIVLDRDGFTMTSGSYRRHARWIDVEDFRVKGIIPTFPLVRFKNTSPSARRRVRLGLGRDWLYGFPGTNAPLANLLNDWRDRAVAERPRPIAPPLPPLRA